LERAVARRVVADTYAYFSNESLRCEADSRLSSALRDAAVAGRPVVLVAHSMGSLVALSVLSRAASVGARFDVPTWVTIGSQLGVEEVRAAVLGSLTAPTVRVPPAVQQWTNIRTRGDALAFTLADAFTAEHRERRPIDTLFTPVSGKNPHNVRSYLAAAPVAAQIAVAWCRAFRAPASAPAACRPAMAGHASLPKPATVAPD
jgi:alpha-beta hydrolase superfamily lysophospholipase